MLGIIFISLYFSASLWTLSSKFFSVNFETSESLFPSTSALGVGVTATSPASNYRAGSWRAQRSRLDYTACGGPAPSSTTWFWVLRYFSWYAEGILQMNRLLDPCWPKGWWMVNKRPSEKARGAFFFANLCASSRRSYSKMLKSMINTNKQRNKSGLCMENIETPRQP